MDEASGTLQDQIEKRQPNNNYFSNEEIKEFLQSLITAFTRIKNEK